MAYHRRESHTQGARNTNQVNRVQHLIHIRQHCTPTSHKQYQRRNKIKRVPLFRNQQPLHLTTRGRTRRHLRLQLHLLRRPTRRQRPTNHLRTKQTSQTSRQILPTRLRQEAISLIKHHPRPQLCRKGSNPHNTQPTSNTPFRQLRPPRGCSQYRSQANNQNKTLHQSRRHRCQGPSQARPITTNSQRRL